MDASTRARVRSRAGDACEYCRIPQQATPIISFHVEHVTARQHGGTDELGQLALACDRCHAYKGPNLTSIDPDSGRIVAASAGIRRHQAIEQHAEGQACEWALTSTGG
ncbi:MAG: HNH endonuclease [Planctomycetes bacterium]|nr:HNH endonuclease [Planctomycetota bacterium]